MPYWLCRRRRAGAGAPAGIGGRWLVAGDIQSAKRRHERRPTHDHHGIGDWNHGRGNRDVARRCPALPTYLCGLSVAPGSATTAITINVTTTGLTNNFTWFVGAPATAVGVTGAVLTVPFNPCVPASAVAGNMGLNGQGLYRQLRITIPGRVHVAAAVGVAFSSDRGPEGGASGTAGMGHST